MIAKRAAIGALERAAEADGDLAVARRFLARVDPLARGKAWRLLRGAHVDALSSTRVRGAAADAHAARLAYLTLSNRAAPAELADDVDAVRAAFDAARGGRRPFRRWAWAWTLLLSLGLAALGFGAMRASRRPVGGGDALDRPAPPTAGAYTNGGAPATDPAARHAFATDLPTFLIALDRAAHASGPEAVARARSDLDAAESRALGPDVRAALGDEASGKLAALLAAARTASAAEADRREATSEAFLDATAALDDALAAKNLAYFVDGDVITDVESGRRMVIVYAFEVRRVAVFEADRRVLALELRRIDHLNWSHALLGFTRPHLRQALVLLDVVDRQLVSTVLPGLGEQGRLPLFDEDAPGASASVVREVEVRAGELVREEYGGAPGVDAVAARRLGDALARRRVMFSGWQRRLAGRGITVVAPAGLHVEADFHAELRPLVPARELTELDDIERAVSDEGVEATFAAARALLVASVARHEVQHRLDFARPGGLPMPAALERWTGPLRQDDKERRGAARARAEMSAYLAELARDERTTRVDATLALRFLFDRRLEGIPECYAAIAMAEALAGELGVPVDGSLVEDGHVARDRAGRLYLAIVAQTPGDLRAAARRAWERSFSAPLPRLVPLAAP